MDAALEIIAEAGVSALTMREAARRSGVSSGAPYRHFADVGALLSALAAEAIERLAAVTAEAIGPVAGDPLRRFRALGVAYVVFAAENPLHFRLMHEPEVSGDPMVADAWSRADEAVDGAIAEAFAAGTIAGSTDAIALASRAAIYGLARMIADGQLGEVSGQRARELALSVTDVIGAGFLSRESGGR